MQSYALSLSFMNIIAHYCHIFMRKTFEVKFQPLTKAKGHFCHMNKERINLLFIHSKNKWVFVRLSSHSVLTKKVQIIVKFDQNVCLFKSV